MGHTSHHEVIVRCTCYQRMRGFSEECLFWVRMQGCDVEQFEWQHSSHTWQSDKPLPIVCNFWTFLGFCCIWVV